MIFLIFLFASSILFLPVYQKIFRFVLHAR
jgi:hypothetical protein